MPRWLGIALHIIALYGIIMFWGADGGSRELILIFMGINIMLAASLNLVNGYMGEFSVGHAGFMAVGAYVSAVLTMLLFTDDRVFGAALLPPELGLPVGFIVALLAGGVAAALAGLLVAFPSFKTRGDYLAIVTLAVNFIVQGVINNIEAIGGARGLNGVPLWTNLSWIFVFTVLSLAAIYNLVNATLGKGIIAIREDEIASSLMGVNTRHIKLVAFLVSSFIAGVAGGLFAHQLAYVNPGNFGILKSTEALVMVYLGGMGSITGSVVAAVIFTILIEALRPLAVLKWVVIPLILIILMLFRPQGLFGFREANLNLGLRNGARSQQATGKEAQDATAAD
ncbi:MAG: branched-chain amino acid ABC transporter permease [Anaerolineae bacterium]|nr:branched-chain amino acid ABC transporter permease [Anaerolineae bacterium]